MPAAAATAFRNQASAYAAMQRDGEQIRVFGLYTTVESTACPLPRRRSKRNEMDQRGENECTLQLRTALSRRRRT